MVRGRWRELPRARAAGEGGLVRGRELRVLRWGGEGGVVGGLGVDLSRQEQLRQFEVEVDVALERVVHGAQNGVFGPADHLAAHGPEGGLLAGGETALLDVVDDALGQVLVCRAERRVDQQVPGLLLPYRRHGVGHPVREGLTQRRVVRPQLVHRVQCRPERGGEVLGVADVGHEGAGPLRAHLAGEVRAQLRPESPLELVAHRLLESLLGLVADHVMREAGPHRDRQIGQLRPERLAPGGEFDVHRDVGDVVAELRPGRRGIRQVRGRGLGGGRGGGMVQGVVDRLRHRLDHLRGEPLGDQLLDGVRQQRDSGAERTLDGAGEHRALVVLIAVGGVLAVQGQNPLGQPVHRGGQRDVRHHADRRMGEETAEGAAEEDLEDVQEDALLDGRPDRVPVPHDQGDRPFQEERHHLEDDHEVGVVELVGELVGAVRERGSRVPQSGEVVLAAPGQESLHRLDVGPGPLTVRPVGGARGDLRDQVLELVEEGDRLTVRSSDLVTHALRRSQRYGLTRHEDHDRVVPGLLSHNFPPVRTRRPAAAGTDAGPCRAHPAQYGNLTNLHAGTCRGVHVLPVKYTRV